MKNGKLAGKVAVVTGASKGIGAATAKALANLEADPVVNGARPVAFMSAEDDGAKKRVETLLEGFGYSVIDLGNLRDGGLIQQAGGRFAGRDLLGEENITMAATRSIASRAQIGCVIGEDLLLG